MTEKERLDYIDNLDNTLLIGHVMLSEWTTFLAKDAETAFASGAYLASILACQATIEAHMRYESGLTKKIGFYDLIESSDFDPIFKSELHEIRKYRNRWVHVNDPQSDDDLLERPDYYEKELELFAYKSIKAMLEVIYYNQGT